MEIKRYFETKSEGKWYPMPVGRRVVLEDNGGYNFDYMLGRAHGLYPEFCNSLPDDTNWSDRIDIDKTHYGTFATCVTLEELVALRDRLREQNIARIIQMNIRNDISARLKNIEDKMGIDSSDEIMDYEILSPQEEVEQYILDIESLTAEIAKIRMAVELFTCETSYLMDSDIRVTYVTFGI